MYTYKKNCAVCQAIDKNEKLLKRIYDCSYFIPHSKDTLRKIYLDGKRTDPNSFSYLSLLNHVKRHQHLNAADYNKKMLIAKAKKAENKIIADRFEAQNIQDAVMNEGMKRLENGEMQITANHLLKAAKDKQDAQAKVRDQQIQLAEMVAFYASGEDKYGSEEIHDRRHIALEEYDPAIPVTENPDLRQN